MPSLNKITLIGNIGKEPEMRYTPSGTPVTSFSLAVSDDYKKDGEWVKVTDWFNVTMWNKSAEYAAQKLHVGDVIYVEGKIKQRTYTKGDGSSGSSMDVTAQSTKILIQKNKPQNGSQNEPTVDDDPFADGDKDLPL